MTTIKILSRWNNEPIYTTEIPDDTPSCMQTRVALEKAASDHANLRGAYLGDAYLSGADLRGADLGGADLGGANLRGAYLSGADLRGVDLRGAYLGGADLGGANLRGAYLGDELKLVGDRPVLCISPIGSVGRTIFAWITDQGLRIEAGCFFGTRDEFLEILEDTHGDNEHAREYKAALTLIDAHVEIWTPVETAKATASDQTEAA